MIYNIIEPSCYQRLTNGLAIPEIAKANNIECKTYTIEEFLSLKCDIDSSNEAIFFTESAFLRSDISFSDVRSLVPNGKIINIGSDSIYFTRENKDEILEVEEVDLWLDTMSECVEYYRNKGLKSEQYYWTISEAYIREIEQHTYISRKEMDFVCLARVNSEYRRNLSSNLFINGYNGYWGTGSISSDLPFLGELYHSCYVCLGTTSPAGNINIRSMKGFRDWIAPFFGTVLIYDYHPDMYEFHIDLDFYEYEYFQSITSIIEYYKDLYIKFPHKYIEKVKKQQETAISNSIEKQLNDLLFKYKYIC